jgi:hypothetical protein
MSCRFVCQICDSAVEIDCFSPSCPVCGQNYQIVINLVEPRVNPPLGIFIREKIETGEKIGKIQG